MTLPRRPLGTTGIEVSVLGLGTVKLGRDQGVKYPAGFKIPDDRAASALIAQATELGINLIDTAPAYGTSEARLGKLLAGQRERWVICSKVGEEFVDGQSRFDFSAAHTRRSVERSLRRLRTDFLDIVLVHSDGNDLAVIDDSGALEALTRLREEGLVRAIGVSTKTVEGGLRAAALSDCVMVTYHLGYEAERPVLDYCAANGKGALIKKALASGHLAVSGQDPVRASLELVLGHPGVSSAIVGTI
ncbi:MAG: aldo/keto reductase, partial [Spongiibacteraceae bacterium]|nr:aldo/keto reductase [Spongiibacteraceae bacterium]